MTDEESWGRSDAEPSSRPPPSASSGWYPDPASDGAYERWWDGREWLDETRPEGGPPASALPSATAPLPGTTSGRAGSPAPSPAERSVRERSGADAQFVGRLEAVELLANACVIVGVVIFFASALLGFAVWVHVTDDDFDAAFAEQAVAFWPFFAGMATAMLLWLVGALARVHVAHLRSQL